MKRNGEKGAFDDCIKTVALSEIKAVGVSPPFNDYKAIVMGYYLRILGINEQKVAVAELNRLINPTGAHVRSGEDTAGQSNGRTMVEIINEQGELLAFMERNLVSEGELGHIELDKLLEEIQECKPVSAVNWLGSYFKKVRVIYAFRLFQPAFTDENYAIIDSIRSFVWNRAGGILQADNEGFSNQDGCHFFGSSRPL